MLLKAFFFFASLILFGLLIQYTVDTPGLVVFDWFGYEIQTTALFAAICFFLLTLFFFVWGRVWSWFMAAPKNLAVQRDKKREKEGFITFFKGLDALAAGDAKKAQNLALKTSELLPDQRLPHMIRAEAAQILGNEEEAIYHFKALAEDKNSAFLGLRGLLSQSYKSKNYSVAYEYAKKAYTLKPQSTWVLRVYFEVLLHLQKFEEALSFLDKLDKKAVLTAEESKNHRGFIAIELAKRNKEAKEYRTAVKQANIGLKALPSFTELGELKVELYRMMGNDKKAVEALVNLWENAPKKEIFALWLNATHGTKNQIKQAQKMTKGFMNTAEGNIALGLTYIENEEWAKAEKCFTKALDYVQNQFIYSKLLLCTQKQNKEEKIQKKWQEKALNSHSYRWNMDSYRTTYQKWCDTYLKQQELSSSKPEQIA